MELFAGSVNLYRVALGCAYIQAGKANVVFPTTSRAHPSYWVRIHLGVSDGSLLRMGDQAYFPLRVPWDFWQKAAVPFLQGEDGINGWTQYEKGMYQSLNTYLGYIWLHLALLWDPSIDQTKVSADIEAYLGEPLLRAPLENRDSQYPRIDPQLAWIEGHPRIDYPKVN